MINTYIYILYRLRIRLVHLAIDSTIVIEVSRTLPIARSSLRWRPPDDNNRIIYLISKAGTHQAQQQDNSFLSQG